MPLRVGVYQQHRPAEAILGGKGPGEIAGNGGLARPTFGVGDCYDLSFPYSHLTSYDL